MLVALSILNIFSSRVRIRTKFRARHRDKAANVQKWVPYSQRYLYQSINVMTNAGSAEPLCPYLY